jgi:hypothetical protein
MSNFWIIGGGRFGLQAAKSLRRSNADATITVIDKQPTICSQLKHLNYHTICSDGIGFLEQNLVSQDFPDWIIPAIPLHVAYEWIKSKLAATHLIESLPLPTPLKPRLPNMIAGESNQVFVSNADFICPDKCPEPDDICVYTGKSRPRQMHAYLKSIRHPDFTSLVIRSQQLLPGVGGYAPGDLFTALNDIKALRTSVLLSTACRCHGVVNAFRISNKS